MTRFFTQPGRTHMKLRRIFAGALGVMALASVTVLGGTSSANVAKNAHAACTASDRHRGAVSPVRSLSSASSSCTSPSSPSQRQQGLRHRRHARPGRHAADAVDRDDQDAGSIIASNAVAVIGPAGSQEVEAVGPLLAKAGLAAISGSATLPGADHRAARTRRSSGSFPDDDVQGPQDANYIIKHLHPKAVS